MLHFSNSARRLDLPGIPDAVRSAPAPGEQPGVSGSLWPGLLAALPSLVLPRQLPDPVLVGLVGMGMVQAEALSLRSPRRPLAASSPHSWDHQRPTSPNSQAVMHPRSGSQHPPAFPRGSTDPVAPKPLPRVQPSASTPSCRPAFAQAAPAWLTFCPHPPGELLLFLRSHPVRPSVSVLPGPHFNGVRLLGTTVPLGGGSGGSARGSALNGGGALKT